MIPFNTFLKYTATAGFGYFFYELKNYLKISSVQKEIKKSINLDLTYEKITSEILGRDILMSTSITKLSNDEKHKDYFYIKTIIEDEYNEVMEVRLF